MSFLEEVALVSEVDKLNDQASEALTLMTLHLCKGLEFPSVTIVGCEEGILPHSASHMDRKQLEEERRLLYVGMTRAKDTLTLMHASSRTLWGSSQSNARSRFLDDIPHEVLDVKSEALSSKFGWLQASSPSPYRRGKASTVQPFMQKAHNEFNQDTETDAGDWLEHVEEELAEGMRIAHRTLGEGIVVSRSGDIIDVRFDTGQTKKLAMGIAPIKILQSVS